VARRAFVIACGEFRLPAVHYVSP